MWHFISEFIIVWERVVEVLVGPIACTVPNTGYETAKFHKFAVKM